MFLIPLLSVALIMGGVAGLIYFADRLVDFLFREEP